jgi:hypothetical protein
MPAADPVYLTIMSIVMPAVAAAIAWRVAGARFIVPAILGALLGLFLPAIASAAPVPLAAALGFEIAKLSTVWS